MNYKSFVNTDSLSQCTTIVWADLSFSSCPSSAVVLITHLQTNPTLILSKCKTTPLGAKGDMEPSFSSQC